jgi:hypothetical protein
MYAEGHHDFINPLESGTCTHSTVCVGQFRLSWSADCVLMGKQNDLLDYQNANIYPDAVNINGINKLSLLTL